MAKNMTSTSVPATNASLVGNTFVSKYYNVLHKSPQLVYRFYTDCSTVSRAEAGACGAIDIVVGHAGINQKIMSLDYMDLRAEIKTVDSLESLSGSVIVMVSGSLSGQGRSKRNFVQTFFLARQEVGYFVLSDMFRYLDGEPEPLVLLETGTVEHVSSANGTAEHVTSLEPVDVQLLPKQETRELCVTSAMEAQPVDQQDEVKEEREAPEVVEVVENVEETSPPIVANLSPQEEEEETLAPPCTEALNAEDTPKTYVSILKHHSNASTTPATPSSSKPRFVPTKTEHGTAPSQATQLASPLAAPNQASHLTADGNMAAELEGDGQSIYVKNLPLNITASELEEEFKKFGPIKAESVNLCKQKAGVCFAFIEYNEASSAQSAIQASPISISGRHVYIEEKKPSPMGHRALRGRFNQGRGSSNMRGGGRGYVGGRGLARDSGQDFFGSGGVHGGGGAKHVSKSNAGNGYRRTDGQGGNWSSHNVRQGSGSQAGTS